MSGFDIFFGMDAIVGNRDVAGKKSIDHLPSEGNDNLEFKAYSKREAVKWKHPPSSPPGSVESSILNENISSFTHVLEAVLKRIMGSNITVDRVPVNIHEDHIPAEIEDTGLRSCRENSDHPILMSFQKFSMRYEFRHVRIYTAGSLTGSVGSSLFTLQLCMVKTEYFNMNYFQHCCLPKPFSLYCKGIDELGDEMQFDFSIEGGGGKRINAANGTAYFNIVEGREDSPNSPPAPRAKEFVNEGVFVGVRDKDGDERNLSALFWDWQEE